MKRSTLALFLSTLALAGGTMACGSNPEQGERGGSEPEGKEKLDEQESPRPSAQQREEDGEGGEGGEGGDG